MFTSGLIFSRSLLEFLGLGYNRVEDKIQIKPVKPEYNDNINIADYGLPYVSPSELSIDEIIVYKWVFEYTNKSIAHITSTAFFQNIPAKIFLAGHSIPKLFITHFFSKFPDPIPDLNAVEFRVGKDVYSIG